MERKKSYEFEQAMNTLFTNYKVFKMSLNTLEFLEAQHGNPDKNRYKITTKAERVRVHAEFLTKLKS